MTATSETAWAGRHVCLGSKNRKVEDPLAGFVFSESMRPHAVECYSVVIGDANAAADFQETATK